ncbi:MAG: DUF3618 domain-containing protein [Rubrobacteraceae bacterium]|uniref:DUF3618 domain-containing protein n=1 Tax=Rubrobacter naiadicus TaxID=1392641 RepID=UPI002360E2BC|nr:DUF3618 domain-containing protein [Rubrobacter naiadicus]MBX6762873.1 DUF3618 domain-containing protein [Rubrobacteraceae bacterium]MCL6438401.1 DUF3618 domain-containing protein [Rubrobacteraceae bacterium]
MSEIPERIEREMFEIRSRMTRDLVDLRKHVDPKVVGERVKENARQRARKLLGRLQKELRQRAEKALASARGQMLAAREASEKRDPAILADAVRSDPVPAAILVAVVVLMASAARRSNGAR